MNPDSSNEGLSDRRRPGWGRSLQRSGLTCASILALAAVVALVLAPAPSFAGTNPCDCTSCHVNHHNGDYPGCTGCHDSPPRTGSHLAHFDISDLANNVTYGDQGVYNTATAYKFGCGNCHPLDPAKHRDDILQVELFNATATAGTVKAKNPASAAYDTVANTCSNVYCHSGKTITSGPVGAPLTGTASPPATTQWGPYIMDATNSNLTYAPYTVTEGRSYQTTPAWGVPGGFSTCTECHSFPLTTSAPGVQAGVGDSHQWIDGGNAGNLHAFNHNYAPLQCRTCHYSTVTATGTWSRTPYVNGVGGDVTTYGPVPLASRATHVNGVPNVAFDTVDPVLYWKGTYSLAGAAYDPATKTCSGVACHVAPRTFWPGKGTSGARLQRNPKWGQPYRGTWGSAECNLCHRY